MNASEFRDTFPTIAEHTDAAGVTSWRLKLGDGRASIEQLWNLPRAGAWCDKQNAPNVPTDGGPTIAREVLLK